MRLKDGNASSLTASSVINMKYQAVRYAPTTPIYSEYIPASRNDMYRLESEVLKSRTALSEKRSTKCLSV